MRVLFIALCCLPLALPLLAPAEGFYFRGEEGWFWYERELEPAPQPAPAPPAALPPAPAATPAPEGPKPLSAPWLRAHLGAYRDAAIDDPSPGNVALYLYLQRLALDKASRFAAATQRAVQRDPFLDEVTQRPTATFAANLVNREAGAHRAQALKAVARQAGVMFFFRAGCPYCEAQAPLLAMLASRYGFTILPISLDGAPPPGDVFPTFSRDRGQAERLGVVSTPALFLARPPDALVPLAQGLLSLAQLEERVVLAAVEAGWIDENVYSRTRPVTADLTLAAAALPSVVPEEPEQLLQVLQTLARAGVPAITAGGGDL